MTNTHTARRDAGPHPAEAPAATSTRPFDLLPTREAARALSVSERTLFTLTQRGDIPAVRIGRSVRYDPADLHRFIEQAKNRHAEKEAG